MFLAGLSRTAFRYRVVVDKDAVLRERLIKLANDCHGLGYPMLGGMLKSEGLVVNHKRAFRLYSEENLQLHQCKKKKLQRPRQPMVVPIAANIRWSMDFVAGQLRNRRPFRILNVKDDYSKELIGKQGANFLDQLIEARSAPDQMTCDNGNEFTSKAFLAKRVRC